MPRMAGDQQTLGKGTGQFLIQSLQEGPMFADTLTLDFWLQNGERIKFLLF